MAKIFQWKYYHTWRSIHSPAGFPDCVMVKPPRLIFAELKSEKGVVSPEQQEWLDLLEQVGKDTKVYDHVLSQDAIQALCEKGTLVEVYLWRPDDIETIAEILR